MRKVAGAGVRAAPGEVSWSELIRLCKVLNDTPADKLEEALGPLLDMDGALKFLAVENVLINNDGYGIRTSDYSIYEDTQGRFHIIPHNFNETFLRPEAGGGPGGPGGRGGFGPGMMLARPRFAQADKNDDPRDGPVGARGSGGPGFNGGPAVKGVELDPLVAANDSNKPLLSKLLAAPALRARYLDYVPQIAEKWLDWNKVGPVTQQCHSLTAEDVKTDTRKLYSAEAFLKSITDDTQAEGRFGGGRQTISLKNFVEQRRTFLLNQAEVKKSGT